MPAKRDVLSHLTRDELLAVVDRFELVVPDRRAKDGLIEAVAGSKKATLIEILPELSRDRLKDVCRALGLDEGGREKALLVDRLAGAKAVADPVTPKASGSTPPKANGAGRATAAEQIELALSEKLTTDKLERYLWSAADILRGSIDSSDYKGFIFGLLFLKRLSDRFDEECELLVRDGHDPDDAAHDPFGRFRYGVPPKTRGDLAFVQPASCCRTAFSFEVRPKERSERAS